MDKGGELWNILTIWAHPPRWRTQLGYSVCILGVFACLNQILFQIGVVGDVTQCPESCFH